MPEVRYFFRKKGRDPLEWLGYCDTMFIDKKKNIIFMEVVVIVLVSRETEHLRQLIIVSFRDVS